MTWTEARRRVLEVEPKAICRRGQQWGWNVEPKGGDWTVWAVDPSSRLAGSGKEARL